jgi:hypothetical protein
VVLKLIRLAGELVKLSSSKVRFRSMAAGGSKSIEKGSDVAFGAGVTVNVGTTTVR